MDTHNDLKNDSDHVVDVNDVNVTKHEEDKNDGPGSSTKNKGSKRIARLKSGALSFTGATKGECSTNPNKLGKSKSESLIDTNKLGQEHSEENLPLLEKKHVKEKSKSSRSKKASKPPRPPKGPSLCRSDIVLLKEMSELAMKKRARIEHMKELKRRRGLKSSSASSNSISCVPVLVFTLLFILVIVFQGICSKNSCTKNFEGSPEPAAAENEFISVQLYNTPSPSDNNGPSSTKSFVENAPGSESRYRI